MLTINKEKSIIEPDDPDLKRWEGYKRIYDILSGPSKARWQCGYNTLQMLLRDYAGIEIPLYTLQLYLRKKAKEYKEREGVIANLTPESMLKFGEFTQLEDMAAYIFGIKPFSDDFNDVMYYPALLSTNIGGKEKLSVGDLFKNEGGKYVQGTPECKDARRDHLACVMEEAKYKNYSVGEKKYIGAQIFARDYEGKGYILNGKEFDELRSKIAVDECKDREIFVGGFSTSISNLFGYEYDRQEYENDRKRYATIFYRKLKNYFEHVGNHAGVPVVFNAMIYLIVGVTLDPEPSVLMLDPHDMQYLGKGFRGKKKQVPMQYILGSPTGATLFFPPNDKGIKEKLREEFSNPDLLNESRIRFCHLLELALFNKEGYLSLLMKRTAGKPSPEMSGYFRMLENFGQNVFDNAILEELCKIFSVERAKIADITNQLMNNEFNFDILADELAHHFSESSIDLHKQYLTDLFRIKTVFISLPGYVKDISGQSLPYKEEMLWKSCTGAGEHINMKRIHASIGPTARAPLSEDELGFYAYIFKSMLYLFSGQDRYSHVEIVDEFFGSETQLEIYYLLAAIGEGLVKGNDFRNFVWAGIVENSFRDLAEGLHRILKESVLLDMSIDRFLKMMEKGDMKIKESIIEDIADEYETISNYLFMPFEAILFFVDRLKTRMKDINIIKRQILVSISSNISTHPDLKERIKKYIQVLIPEASFDYHETRERLMDAGLLIHSLVTKGEFKRGHLYELAEGTFFRNPERSADTKELIEIMNNIRIAFRADMDGLQNKISANIGNIGMIDKIANVMHFNDLFKLEGSKETEFASKINTVYSKLYEGISFDDEDEENISPLTIHCNK